MNFFDALRTRLEKKVPGEFDKVFWIKFESEFGKTPAFDRYLRYFRELCTVPRLATAAVAVIVALVVVNSHILGPRKATDTLEITTAALGLVSHQEMISDLPLLKAFDRLPTSDEEWRVLLAEDDKPL